MRDVGFAFTLPSAGDMRNQSSGVGDGELRMKCSMLNPDQGKRLLPSMKPCSFCARKVLPQYAVRTEEDPMHELLFSCRYSESLCLSTISRVRVQAGTRSDHGMRRNADVYSVYSEQIKVHTGTSSMYSVL